MKLTPLEVTILFGDEEESGGPYRNSRGGCLSELLGCLLGGLLAVFYLALFIGTLFLLFKYLG